MGFREKIARFMQGRNGPDPLSRALSFASLALIIIAIILNAANVTIGGTVLWWIALALMVACYWRILSKDITRRYRENVKYLNLRDKFLAFFRRNIAHLKQLRTHRFFKCPGCAQRVRTPRGKGKIRVTCPKCATSFVRKS